MASAVSRLCIGVGAFGSLGRGGAAQAFAAVALAADAGVRALDCPSEPDGAERVLGQVLPRREPAFAIGIRTAAVDGGAPAVLRRVRTSLRRLGQERVAAVLARPAQLLADDGPRLWAGLQALKDEGVVGALGVAACVCDDPAGLARRFRPDLMQLPLSLLDQRLLTNGAVEEVAGRGVAVHLRSVFAHGALFGTTAAPVALSPQVSRVRRLLAEAGADPMQAALAFALNQPAAAQVVVGVGSAAELRAVIRAACAAGPALDWDALRLEARCGTGPARCRAA